MLTALEADELLANCDKLSRKAPVVPSLNFVAFCEDFSAAQIFNLPHRHKCPVN